jgi:hypothetical protein
MAGVLLGAAAALLAAGCGTSDGVLGPVTTAAETVEPVEIGLAGGEVRFAGGVIVEALPGTFTGPTRITVAATGAADLPVGVGAVGGGFSIIADAAPEIPILVGLPIPPGVPREGLFMLRTTAGGEQQILGGFVEGDTYLAATQGFSDFRLVTHRLQEALTLFTDVDVPDLDPAGDGTDAPSLPGAGFISEYWGLVKGTVSAPAHRSARIVGPGEVAVGGQAVYAVFDFLALEGWFVETAWSIHGGSLTALSAPGDSRFLVEGVAEGRAIVVAEVTDPLTGATAFASARVFVAADTLAITALPTRTEYYAWDQEGPVVLTFAVGGRAPYRWSWVWGDGASGVSELDSPTITRSPISADMTLTITVVDASGAEATVTVAMRGYPGGRDVRAALLSGPTSGRVGEEIVYRVLFRPDRDAWELPFRAVTSGPAGEVEVDGEVIRAVFREPGLAVIRLFEEGPLEVVGGSSAAFALVRIEGDAPPAEAGFSGLPDRVSAGESIVFNVEGRGGIVARPDGAVPYQATVDFGDGTVVEVVIPAVSALEWAGAQVEHAWEEEGTFVVSVELTTPDGQTAVASTTVEVVPGLVEAAGEFQFAEVEGLTVLANEVYLVIEDGTVTFEKFVLRTRYLVHRFELDDKGKTISVPTDCVQTARTVLRDQAVTLNERMRFRGTLTIRDLAEFEGSECPFGGGGRDVVRVGEVTGTLEGGEISIRVFFPTVPEAYERTLAIVAGVL